MPRQCCPYVKKAAMIWSMHHHWPARGAAKKALQKAGLPCMKTMPRAQLWKKMDNVREMKKRLDLVVEKDQQLMEDESSHNTTPSDDDGEENSTTCTTSTISTTVDVEITSSPVIIRASSRISQKNKTTSPLTVTLDAKDLSISASDPKGFRLTSQQRLSSAARVVKEKRKRNIAFNEACVLLRDERKKHKGSTTSKPLSANQVAEQVGKKYNVSLCKRTLNHKLLSGESFQIDRVGPKGFFATDIEYTLVASPPQAEAMIREDAEPAIQTPTIADEVTKLKSMFDDGTLTKEEFQHAKKKVIFS